MATVIHLSGDHLLGNTIRIIKNKVFHFEKDRITINDQVVFEDKIIEDTPYRFDIEDRTYFIRIRKVHKFATMTVVIDVEIYENNELVHVSMYDKDGNPIKSERQAQVIQGHKVCNRFGALIGIITMFALMDRTPLVSPNGSLGVVIYAVIFGAIGYGIGYGFGFLMLGRK